MNFGNVIYWRRYAKSRTRADMMPPEERLRLIMQTEGEERKRRRREAQDEDEPGDWKREEMTECADG